MTDILSGMVFNITSDDAVERGELDIVLLLEKEVDVDQSVIESVSVVWA
jgi:hypothetical protein